MPNSTKAVVDYDRILEEIQTHQNQQQNFINHAMTNVKSYIKEREKEDKTSVEQSLIKRIEQELFRNKYNIKNK